MWSITENASDLMNGSVHPSRYGTRIRCPDDEIGRNSVSPWTIPSTSAWNAVAMKRGGGPARGGAARLALRTSG